MNSLDLVLTKCCCQIKRSRYEEFGVKRAECFLKWWLQSMHQNALPVLNDGERMRVSIMIQKGWLRTSKMLRCNHAG